MPSQITIVRAGRLLLAVILVLATILLLIQYLHNRSLWLDEAMLALNIIRKDFGGLLKPLEFTQVAPVLFLWIEKSFTSLLGKTELALRLFPLLCAIASLPLFYKFSAALTKNKAIALVALCLIACTPKFVYYSSETKQYAVDVFILTAIYFSAFGEHAFLNKYRPIILSITGAIAAFLSNISVIPLFTVALYFFYRSFREKKDRITIFVPLILWAVCLGANYFLFIRNHPYAPIMKEYWKDSFMPPNPFHPPFMQWLNLKARDVFGTLLPSASLPGAFMPDSYLFMVTLYCASSLSLLLTKQFRMFYLCLTPLVLHLLLSALKIYPFDLRLILYLVPLFLLVIANGLYQITSILHKWPLAQYALLGLFVTCFLPGIIRAIPIDSEEIRPIISDINYHIQPTHTVYVYYGSKPAFLYYRETGYAGFGTAKILFGQSHLNDNEGFLTEFQQVKGMTWLLFSHVYPFDGSRGEEQYIVKGLMHKGILVKEFQSFGSSAYLFDLK